ncbi:Saccharopine dehydrogenase [Sticta canariensis]|nr:Saccharopine dehydrogenase [Sticta canariensis]
MKKSHGKDLAYSPIKAKDLLNIRVGIADTVGSATRREDFGKIRTLRRVVGCDIETHFHNDTGCAIANAYYALESGATQIDTTVLGIGERNGITPLGGLIGCLIVADRKHIVRKYRIDKLGYVENLAAQAAEVEIPFNNWNVSFLQKLESTSLDKPSEVEVYCD